MAQELVLKKGIIESNRIHEKDTGSPEVQVALLTERIRHLTEHLKSHMKDHSSRRGLLILVGKRSKLLKFLKNNSGERYSNLIQKIGIRH